MSQPSPAPEASAAPTLMKAVVARRYGSPDVLSLEEIPRPEPGPGEILVRIRAASVNAGDWHIMRGVPFAVRFFTGLTKPKFPIYGADVAGEVVATGEGASEFQPGDAVFGDVSAHGFGGFAEYVCAPETSFVKKPENIDFATAAATPAAGLTALQGLRKHGKLQPGERVLINGASGGVGSFAVQIAKAFGGEVTAVASTSKLEMLRSLGADHVIDYTKENFTENGQQYDVILAANGFQPITAYRRALANGGRYFMSGGEGKQLTQAMLLGPLLSLFDDRKLGNYLMTATREDMETLRDLLAEGKIAPVMDRRYPLAEVPAAVAYVEEGHARGKVVIDVAGD